MKNTLLVLLLAVLCSCASTSKSGQDASESNLGKYGRLSSAVLSASDQIVGMYLHQIPTDMDGKRFMQEIKGKIPSEQYEALKKYKIDIEPKGAYYLLLAHDHGTGELVLFDYSCDMKIDGPVYARPELGSHGQIEQSDICKSE